MGACFSVYRQTDVRGVHSFPTTFIGKTRPFFIIAVLCFFFFLLIYRCPDFTPKAEPWVQVDPD